ncbi:HAMP domain-containing histidine kinase [Paenibacillus albiflavus]|uniref:histidine kinase n=2 Tax=Paenibacillus albiflavus TaxID=2545760 RepID=A0A4R4EKM3_9BACL|nr:HAMP domain-containing histidine kinase [Paenibacillus albiflavus]
MKFRHSLLAKYLLIIMIGLALWPLIIPISILLYNTPGLLSQNNVPENIYAHGDQIARMWNEEAAGLADASSENIHQKLQQLSAKYDKATIFWVDEQGITQLRFPDSAPIPAEWRAGNIIQFMKNSYDGDPFTSVAMIGKEAEQGFMVLQIPRALMVNEFQHMDSRLLYAIFLLIIFLFIFISWMFFMKIRKRLVRLQTAMSTSGDTGIPEPITVKKKDEISRLEHSFNLMIHELTASRKREQEEEELRKQLIANLSHDLRTPLTTIRGHAYSLRKEIVSTKGVESIDLIESKSDYLAQLIENLLSYTLLTTGKYPMRLARVDVLRTIRTAAASWYPVFEKEGFEVDVRLSDTALYWDADELWLTRILDNLFQNIIRHAKDGKYVAIRMENYQSFPAIVVEDKGPGMKSTSGNQGARIGLTIIAMMVKEMKLEWDIVSTENGTAVYLYSPKLNKS